MSTVMRTAIGTLEGVPHLQPEARHDAGPGNRVVTPPGIAPCQARQARTQGDNKKAPARLEPFFRRAVASGAPASHRMAGNYFVGAAISAVGVLVLGGAVAVSGGECAPAASRGRLEAAATGGT